MGAFARTCLIVLFFFFDFGTKVIIYQQTLSPGRCPEGKGGFPEGPPEGYLNVGADHVTTDVVMILLTECNVMLYFSILNAALYQYDIMR